MRGKVRILVIIPISTSLNEKGHSAVEISGWIFWNARTSENIRRNILKWQNQWKYQEEYFKMAKPVKISGGIFSRFPPWPILKEQGTGGGDWVKKKLLRWSNKLLWYGWEWGWTIDFEIFACGKNYLQPWNVKSASIGEGESNIESKKKTGWSFNRSA